MTTIEQLDNAIALTKQLKARPPRVLIRYRIVLLHKLAWTRKLKLAQTKLKIYNAKIKYYEGKTNVK